MELLEKNQDLTPFKLCLCILLYEGLSNSHITSNDRGKILNFIIKHIQNTQGLEISYADLLESLEEIESDSLSESPKQILQARLTSMTDFSDVLQLFIVKLNELKSDGEISSGCLEQGGILYLFLRKCFVNFARMGFEDLVRLSKKLEEYKIHSPLVQNSKVLASQMAESLEELILNENYETLEGKIGALNTESTHLLKGHLDAHYNKHAAIDSIHRYFDLILDKQMPTKTTREKGLVVVQSSTHFASLHRVKIELQLGHLEAAVHLLVETIKRALSENDNLVILESTLLFMKIAGMMGNYKQEKRISQKAVLHALKIENINALVQATLLYSQLHLIYAHADSLRIFNEIQPKIDNKNKSGVPVPRKLVMSEKVSTWNNLCDYTLMQSLLNHEHSGLNKKLNFIHVISWLNQGYDWNLNLNIDSLIENFQFQINEVDFYLELCRVLFENNQDQALSILRFIDKKCKEKKCVKWDFTLYFIGHYQSIHKGEFLKAEKFEDLAQLAGGDKHEIKLMRLQRFSMQKRLKQGFDLGNELIEYFTEKGLISKLCKARLLLSQIYFESQEYYRALFELNKCLDVIQDVLDLEIPIKIAMAESSLQAFASPLISLNLLNSIENKIYNKKSPMMLASFYKAKANVSLALSQTIGESPNGEVFKRTIGYLEVAEKELKNQKSLWELRDIYYLQARTYDLAHFIEARNEYSDKFCEINKEINLNSKKTVARQGTISIDMILNNQ